MGKRYRVVGPRKVHGKSKGDVVTLDLTPGQERVLVRAGHIKPEPPERKKETAVRAEHVKGESGNG